MITVIGSINIDLVAKAQRLPRPGETVAGRDFTTNAGGKGANQALAARRAGADVKLVGAVGKDAFADAALVSLIEENVCLSDVKRVDEATGTALISVCDDGENSIIIIPGANGALTIADAEEAVAAMESGDILMLQLEVPADVVEGALKVARSKQIRTVLNIAPLVPSAPELALLADIVVANETEFHLLAGESKVLPGEYEQILRRTHRRSQQTFIVTLGKDGAIAIDKGNVYRVSGLTVTVIDTVGAGDTFCGYLAAGLAASLPFPQALRRAAVAGSLACMKPGAQPAIPFLLEVQRYPF
ncbi:ribokinase [Microvirga yunnanensis]|uniref:ribokinase n=1 Tax=Microvirga yunnanensis TaxID=2953740 RepID=UPI0021C8DF27|nr:ribokinase [Microvirga sp. HBU65207]